MKILHKHLLPALLFLGSHAYAFDPGSFAGGAASIMAMWLGYGAYAKHTDETARKEKLATYKTEYQEVIEKLQQHLNDEKSCYNALSNALEVTDPDEQIQAMASFLVHESTNSNGLMDCIGGEVARLRKYISQAQQHDRSRRDDSGVDDTMQQNLYNLMQQAQEKTKKLQSLYDLVKKEHPFIELNCAGYTEHERQSSYDRTLKYQARFAHIDTIDAMNNDAQRLMHAIEQAQTWCKQHGCNNYKEQLIAIGKQQLSYLEKQQSALVNSKEFLEEKKAYDAFQLEKEKTAQAQLLLQAQCTQERMENQRHEIKIREQEIKKEQLRQNDEQLKQNEEQLQQTQIMLAQGRYFEPQKERYKGKIKALKKEKCQLESQLESIDKEYQEKLDCIHKESTELDKLLHNPPVNPEAQEGLAAFLTEALASAQRIYAKSSVK